MEAAQKWEPVVAGSKTASLTIAELREYAMFTAAEQLYIERSLDIGLLRGNAFKLWSSGAGDGGPIRSQYIAYRELRALRAEIPAQNTLDGIDAFMGPMIRIAALDLVSEQLSGFCAFRFLYERLLGAAARPWLPAIFCGAAALPQIRPLQRKVLLQSLSEAAATAPGWSEREPAFFPHKVEDEAA